MNGEVRQDGNTEDMIYDIWRADRATSRSVMTLSPATSSPPAPRRASRADPAEFLKAGDIVASRSRTSARSRTAWSLEPVRAHHAARVSIYLPGFAHRNPVPAASRIGPHVHSGALTGRDPDAGEMPPTLDAQCANVFGHVRAVMAAAGGSTDDIVEITSASPIPTIVMR